jgi:sigma-B regulation protein RsbU (phosphoserine phosphatase)
MIDKSGQSSKNLLQQLMDNMTDNIYFKDSSSRLILVNKAYAEWLHFDDIDDCLGKTDFDLFTAEHAQQAYDDEQKIITTNAPLIAKEEKETWEDGHETWVSTTKLPLKDESGNIIGTFGISRDITENKRNEIKLQQYADKLRRINEQTHNEIRMAANLQRMFLPQNYPVITNSCGEKVIEFHHHYLADSQISGDFCAINQLNDSQIGVLICDVMGHGVRAALITGIIRAMSDDLSKKNIGPDEFLSNMNEQLYPILNTNDAFIFASACYVVVDLKTGRLTGASAGHTTPIIIAPAEEHARMLTEADQVSGPALAITPAHTYKSFSCQLRPHETLLLYTDGVFEVSGQNKEEFGIHRLAKSLHTHREQPLREMIDRLVSEARDFSDDGFEDDVCLIGFTLNRLLA